MFEDFAYRAMQTAGTQIYAAKQNVIDPNLYPIYRTSTEYIDSRNEKCRIFERFPQKII